MRKFLFLLGVFALFAGLRLFDNGLLNIGQAGEFTVYRKGGAEVYGASERPALDRFGAYTRLDTFGDAETALAGLGDLYAKVLWTEEIDGIVIFYAYSPFINRYETVSGKRVNVMAAVRGGKVAYGCPLLKGSY